MIEIAGKAMAGGHRLSFFNVNGCERGDVGVLPRLSFASARVLPLLP